MNLGYLPDGGRFDLAPEDEPLRHFIGLYHQAVVGLPLMGSHILEVGCSNGGGANWLARWSGAVAVTGLDQSAAALRQAERNKGNVPGLSFVLGEAGKLPFPDASLDILVNIESSHCYPSMEGFLCEAARVLRAGGWLTWADIRGVATLPVLDRAFAMTPFALRHEAQLNPGVLLALDVDEARKFGEISKHPIPRALPVVRSFLEEFAVTRGSKFRAGLEVGRLLYLARRYQRV